jgi:uncharacterized coiled-coil DUF342 family protein
MSPAPPAAGVKKTKKPRSRPMTIDEYYQQIIELLDKATHIDAETRTRIRERADYLYNSILESRAREAELQEQMRQAEERLRRLREQRRLQMRAEGICKCNGRVHRIQKGRRRMPAGMRCLG